MQKRVLFTKESILYIQCTLQARGGIFFVAKKEIKGGLINAAFLIVLNIRTAAINSFHTQRHQIKP